MLDWSSMFTPGALGDESRGEWRHVVTKPVSEKLARDLRRNGSIILSVFALVWAVAVPGLTSPTVEATAFAIAVLVTVAMVSLALRATVPPGEMRRLPADWQRRYNVIGIVEGVAIGLAVAVLIFAGRPELIPSLVCLIVGAHFFPLARLFDQRQYAWTGTSLCAIAVAGWAALVLVDSEAGRAIVGFGAAATLWATSAHLSLRG